MQTSKEVSRLDCELSALAREEVSLRLRLGQALEVLGRGAHFDLGFSSLAAYALERCERGVRWVEAARCLARRLETLPELRRAVAFGIISWSMVEILVRVAQPETEAAWLEAAKGRTVREMRALVRSRAGGGPGESGSATETEDGSEDDSQELCTLACTVDQEEAWLFEATRTLLDQLGTHGASDQIEALLAEGQCTLLGALQRSESSADDWDPLGEGPAEVADAAQRHWREELRQFRVEAEVLCEERIRGRAGRCSNSEQTEGAMAAAAAHGYADLQEATSRELDAVVRDLSRRLACQELAFAQSLVRFHRNNGFRRLGYATDAQYARERLGMSRSSMLARRALGFRLDGLPRVAAALGQAKIGVEAAIQIVRVATQRTEAAWIERAMQRTLKHLREEVSAAQVARRLSGELDCPPPEDGELTAFQELERAVISGQACQAVGAEREPAGANDIHGRCAHGAQSELPSEVGHGVRCEHGARGGHAREGDQCSESEQAPRRAWRAMLSSLAAWLAGGLQPSRVQLSAVDAIRAGIQMPVVQMSAAEAKARASGRLRSTGRVALRLRVSRELYVWWHRLAARAQRLLPHRLSFLSFLCLSVWRAWRHLLGADVAYGQIYLRDRFRCTSPVCNRRDVTPHHLRFRSAGGSDADTNVVAVCTWCHLFGVHGGRIRAIGTAEDVKWELGPRTHPCVVVHGRRRMAA